MEADYAYFSRRALEEREAAMKSPHPAARRSHLELAGRYLDLASAIESHSRSFPVDGAGAAQS